MRKFPVTLTPDSGEILHEHISSFIKSTYFGLDCYGFCSVYNLDCPS